MRQNLTRVIKGAGNEILRFHETREFTLKKDKSPLSLADQASHQYLCEGLLHIKNIPILSEETEIEGKISENCDEYWVIDPLDGTKEFINGFNDFCINVALMQDEKPVLGIIYAPKLKELYWADLDDGFEYEGPSHNRVTENTIVALSRFHHSSLTKKFIDLNGLKYTNTIGSAIKFGRMALGQIDLYPRFEGSKQWDTAAGQVILEAANCSIIDLGTKIPLEYNKLNLKNNYFIAARPNINLDLLQYPVIL